MWNTIIMWDVYVVAETAEDARETVKSWIAEGNAPTEENAREARDKHNVRLTWHEKRPLVGQTVGDADFDRIKGHTTIEIWHQIYAKSAKAKNTNTEATK